MLMLLVLVCPIRLEPFENLTVFSVKNPVEKTTSGAEVYLVEGKLDSNNIFSNIVFRLFVHSVNSPFP